MALTLKLEIARRTTKDAKLDAAIATGEIITKTGTEDKPFGDALSLYISGAEKAMAKT